MKALFLILVAAVCLLADNVVHPEAPVLDRPTLTSLGVKLPVTGDDNFNASVAVRYRVSGTSVWSTGLPLFRVHPETVVGWTVAPGFGGSIFDLRPNTSYDLQFEVMDPDGPVDQVYTLTASTRTIPGDPMNPRYVNVQDDASLATALQNAQPGDIIQLANGTYHGPIFVFASGTASNPIVIRGASTAGVIFDGANCSSCNILEFYSSYIHLEQVTLQNAQRAIRFQTDGEQGNVVRHIHTVNTIMGISTRQNNLDFYVCDNILEGRLAWPLVYKDDGGLHANDDGVQVAGFGNVICHNRLSGFGDAMKTEQTGARSNDFYGNEILWTYDNGVELDDSEGNVRLQRNRFTNNSSPLSVQPIYGGPAYMTRNVVINVADEQMKFHGLVGPQWDNPVPSGVLAYHNTFMKAGEALLMNTPDWSHYFDIGNNLFIGKTDTQYVVNWGGPIDHGTFDYNAYFPDGQYTFNFYVPVDMSQYQNWPSFAAMQAGGLEPHGLLVPGPPFASPIPMGSDYTSFLAPQDPQLAAGSTALDRGKLLPNINDGFTGTAPDLGALERGCPEPIYGPRPAGIDESNEPFGCVATSTSTSPTPTPPTLPAPSAITVAVSPTTLRLAPGTQQKFVAVVSGTSNPGVTWSISPSFGSIASDGTYTAPIVPLPQTQAIVVTATSQADATKAATARVTLETAIPVFGTGVAATGSLAAAGSADAHYTLVSGPGVSGPSAYVANSQAYPFPLWIADGPASAWITPTPASGSALPTGTYVYRTSFDMTGLDLTTASLNLSLAADFLVTVKLNGTQIGGSLGGWWALTPLAITNGFVSGVNTLDFTVTSLINGPTGIQVRVGGTAYTN